jgi:3-isopropylmalate/(R)-2-methylmalate dehydratase small subunit
MSNYIINEIAAPIAIDNLDTDQIMPKQFLRTITKEGLDKGCLYDLRFDENGAKRSDFSLNQDKFKNAGIIIAGKNFGCGSSREHAVWGLQQLGVKAIIAPSYGEIFFGNSINNRLLTIILLSNEVDELMDLVENGDNNIEIDVKNLVVKTSKKDYHFKMQKRHKQMIIENIDMITLSLRSKEKIEIFEKNHFQNNPWSDLDLSNHKYNDN